jgi:hypothetical protein
MADVAFSELCEVHHANPHCAMAQLRSFGQAHDAPAPLLDMMMLLIYIYMYTHNHCLESYIIVTWFIFGNLNITFLLLRSCFCACTFLSSDGPHTWVFYSHV